MKRVHGAIGVILSVALASAVFADSSAVSSRGAETKRMNLTVYNSGRGLVSDQRSVALPGGQVELRFMDVARDVMPETVSIRAVDGAGELQVLEQNYEYDLLTPTKLLDKYVGKELLLGFSRMKDNSSVLEETPATLLSNNEGQVFRIGDGIVVNPGYQSLRFAALPDTLIAEPSLVWQLSHKTAGTRAIEATYLTNGISWKADYVLKLEPSETAGALHGWVTIDNESGATYRNARMQLVAGDINQVVSQDYNDSAVMAVKAESRVGSGFQQKEFFEYHLYTLERPTTLKDRQQKQISLLQGEGLSVQKGYVIEAPGWYYQQKVGKQKEKVAVQLAIQNSSQNHLGMPIPKGIVRVYKVDSDGSSQFVGEDAIDHTPANERIELTIGNAFDVVAERAQLDWKTLGNSATESEWSVVIRNHKKEAIDVIVRERIFGDWQILEESHPSTKVEAFGAEFKVPVKANGESTLRYRVRIRS